MAYEPTLEHLTSIDFKIETGGGTILFRDYTTQATLETYPANSIIAVANGADIRVQFKGGAQVLVNNIPFNLIKIDGSLVTQVQATAIDELNALFANTGGGAAPTITSSASIALTVGNSINFTPTGSNVVTWSYDTLPTGIVSVEGQHKTIIGGSGFVLGTYSIVVRATNYHGSVTQNITLTVNPTFTNTYSFEGTASNSYFNTGATVIQNNTSPFYMAAGTSVGTPWTFWAWVKVSSLAATSGHAQLKNILSFGSFGNYGYGTTERGVLFSAYKSSSGAVALRFEYGNTKNAQFVRFIENSSTTDTWHSVMITYNGGDTADGTLNAFSMGVDGVAVSPATYVGGSGASQGVYCGYTYWNTNHHHIGHTPPNAGRYSEYLKISELATFGSDQFANLATFHNLGSGGFDFAPYSPTQWYRMGDDGDYAAFPLMTNKGSLPNLDMTMINGTVANYVSDVP